LVKIAHWAEIDENNIVTRVLVVADGVEDGQTYLADGLGLGGTWLKTSYNTVAGEHRLGGTPLRGNYAGIGYKYDAALDAFIAPQPFPSWTLDTKTYTWNAPVAMPTDGKLYTWNEESKSWDVVPETAN